MIVAGLASRRVDSLPGFVVEHAGDTLWATAAVLALALVWRTDARTVALAGFGAAVFVELSQLWKPAWLEELRENDLVALAIGRGWVWGDLVRYAVGAALGYGILRLVDRSDAPMAAAEATAMCALQGTTDQKRTIRRRPPSR